MVISCIGDSLTEGDYGIPGVKGVANIHPENYPYFLGNILKAEVRNYGKCGYRSGQYLAHYEEGNADVRGSDVILIMLGSNGGQSPTDWDTEENVSYRKLVAACQKDAPEAKVVLCTPPHATENTAYINCGAAPQVKNAVEFVRLYAAREGLSMIDVALCPDFTAENEHIMQANDGLHFVEAGYRTLAAYIAEGLKKLFPDLF